MQPGHPPRKSSTGFPLLYMLLPEREQHASVENRTMMMAISRSLASHARGLYFFIALNIIFFSRAATLVLHNGRVILASE